MKKTEPLDGAMAGGRGWNISKRTVDRLSVTGRDTVFWDETIPGFGVAGLSVGNQVLRGPESRSRTVPADHGGSSRSTLGRRGPPAGSPHHRAPQGLGSTGRGGIDRGHGRRDGGTLSPGTRGGALQGEDPGSLPGGRPSPPRAGARRNPSRGRYPGAGVGPSLPAPRNALCRESGGRGARPDPRHGPGARAPGAGHRQPVPVGREVPGAPARAVSSPRKNSAAWEEYWTKRRAARAVRHPRQ